MFLSGGTLTAFLDFAKVQMHFPHRLEQTEYSAALAVTGT